MRWKPPAAQPAGLAGLPAGLHQPLLLHLHLPQPLLLHLPQPLLLHPRLLQLPRLLLAAQHLAVDPLLVIPKAMQPG